MSTSTADDCRLASALSNGPAHRSPNWPAGFPAFSTTDSALARMNARYSGLPLCRRNSCR
jgi:hypothetical protein